MAYQVSWLKYPEISQKAIPDDDLAEFLTFYRLSFNGLKGDDLQRWQDDCMDLATLDGQLYRIVKRPMFPELKRLQRVLYVLMKCQDSFFEFEEDENGQKAIARYLPPPFAWRRAFKNALEIFLENDPEWKKIADWISKHDKPDGVFDLYLRCIEKRHFFLNVTERERLDIPPTFRLKEPTAAEVKALRDPGAVRSENGTKFIEAVVAHPSEKNGHKRYLVEYRQVMEEMEQDLRDFAKKAELAPFLDKFHYELIVCINTALLPVKDGGLGMAPGSVLTYGELAQMLGRTGGTDARFEKKVNTALYYLKNAPFSRAVWVEEKGKARRLWEIEKDGADYRIDGEERKYTAHEGVLFMLSCSGWGIPVQQNGKTVAGFILDAAPLIMQFAAGRRQITASTPQQLTGQKRANAKSKSRVYDVLKQRMQQKKKILPNPYTVSVANILDAAGIKTNKRRVCDDLPKTLRQMVDSGLIKSFSIKWEKTPKGYTDYAHSKITIKRI